MRPVTAIGRWSTRRPWRAIAAWLAFVVAALVAMSVMGTKSLQNGAVGESARGYTLMNEHQAWGPTREYGYLHSDTLRAQDPAFRAATAVVAALVPLLLALTAVAAAFGLLGPISQQFPLDDSVKTVIVLIGMAVGVDYALFYVIRSREERRRGLPSHQALERTARTSGRTVIVSGTTVAIAMAGMFIVGAKVFNGIASGTIIVVACAVAGSVTVLSAV